MSMARKRSGQPEGTVPYRRSERLTMQAIASLVAALALVGTGATAATLTETENFSGQYRTPSRIDGAVVSGVSGTWSHQNDYDLLAISGLSGGQTLRFTFVPLTDAIGHSFSAGGKLLYQESPFRWSNWEGTTFGEPDFDYDTTAPQSFSVTLSEGFNEGGGGGEREGGEGGGKRREGGGERGEGEKGGRGGEEGGGGGGGGGGEGGGEGGGGRGGRRRGEGEREGGGGGGGGGGGEEGRGAINRPISASTAPTARWPTISTVLLRSRPTPRPFPCRRAVSSCSPR